MHRQVPVVEPGIIRNELKICRHVTQKDDIGVPAKIFLGQGDKKEI
jgi:hypothetical protein